jgi:hypothetical protein
MYNDFVYSFVVSFTGAILFLLVDKHEPNRIAARLLKFLLLFVSSVVVMHRLRPYGVSLF